MKAPWIAILPLLGLPLLGTFEALAQSKGHTYTPGNVLHPGGVPPQAPANAPIAPMGGYGQPRPHRSSGARTARTAVVAVPVLVGVGSNEAPPQQASDASAAAIVNRDFQPQASNPVLQDYSNSGLLESPQLAQRQSEPPPAVIQQAEDPGATIYLIALNDGTIKASIGFWMDGDTLNYITRDGVRNRISIDRVDREFSVKLNAERGLEFKL